MRPSSERPSSAMWLSTPDSSPAPSPPQSPLPRYLPRPPYGGREPSRGKSNCIILLFFGAILSLLFALLSIWLVLHPRMPAFYLTELSLSPFDISSAAKATATPLPAAVQAAFVSENHSPFVGIFYDNLYVSLIYRSEQLVGGATQLAPLVQKPKKAVAWSPTFTAASAAAEGFQDMEVEIQGNIGWKVGKGRTGQYRLHVNCQANLVCDGAGAGLQLLRSSRCSVSINPWFPAF